jgi:hypothetical protein
MAGFFVQLLTSRSVTGRRRKPVAVIARRPTRFDDRSGRVGVTELVGHRRRRPDGPAVVMTLGGGSGLGYRSHKQGRTEKGEDCLSHRKSPIETLCSEEGCPACRRLDLHIAMLRPDYYVGKHHETASKFVGQKIFRLNIQQANRASQIAAMDFLGRSGSIESG